jgi:hypothetical protein
MKAANLTLRHIVRIKEAMKHHDRPLLTRLAKFSRSEDGAVTVDWIVVTAAMVGLAIAAGISVGGAAVDHSDRINDKMIDVGIRSY